MNPEAKYVEVIIPVAIKGSFTYSIPPQDIELVLPGMRVLVNFGKNKLYSGIIKEVHERHPQAYKVKEYQLLLDEVPVVQPSQIQMWEWLSRYYMCSLGEVMNAALPNGMKLASETSFERNPEFSDYGKLDMSELNFLEDVPLAGSISLDEIRKGSQGKMGVRLARKLVEKEVLIAGQALRKAYKAKKINVLSLAPAYLDESSLNEVLESLTRAPKQLEALEVFLQETGLFQVEGAVNELDKSVFAKQASSSGLNALIKKGIIQQREKKVSRIHYDVDEGNLLELPRLNKEQQKAFRDLKKSYERLPVSLLHGITSSGKTAIYMHLMEEVLKEGKQVLYLLPEIALTTQIIRRLKEVFGNKVGVYHSRYSDHERVEVYRNIAGLTEKAPFPIILGVRSAIFLPFKNLGLIIIDEEHENTYKQQDPAPRYHARDVATILGLYSGAKVLMGSATPSFESLYNTHAGKYGLAKLESRYGNSVLPELVIADVTKAQKRKQLRSHFTPELLNGIRTMLEEGGQAILFQNRRGYSNYLQCSDCGHILKCGNCDVSLTYHKFTHEMLCHYCGVKHPPLKHCPECNTGIMSMRGFGTEKIEDDLEQEFPGIRVGRLDVDKARTRGGIEKVITEFELGKIDVLVGTQLVTKGLDFDRVSLVGIIDADSMLNFPDFRAFERSFQLMVQVAGRAGRREQRGKVIIQSRDPEHPVLLSVLNNDFEGFFKSQMEERKLFSYPPYVRIIRITLKHEIPSILDGGSVFLAGEMKDLFGGRVLGPQQPVIGRTHGKYIKQIILKVEKELSVEKTKQLLSELLDIFNENPVYRQIRCAVDVDPM